MKQIISLFILLSCSWAFANNKSTLRCLEILKDGIPANRYQHYTDHNTTLLMFSETTTGIHSRDFREGFLLIEEENIQVCGMEWSQRATRSFTITESTGDRGIAYNRDEAPHFRELGFWAGLAPSALTAPKRRCTDASIFSETNELLKKIILKQLEDRFRSNANYEVPMECSRTAGITSYDIEMMRRRLGDPRQAPGAIPRVTTPAPINAEDGP